MIIKIDKQKVVDAAELAISHLDDHDKHDRSKIIRLWRMQRTCSLTDDQTVTITDEDVELLGL